MYLTNTNSGIKLRRSMLSSDTHRTPQANKIFSLQPALATTNQYIKHSFIMRGRGALHPYTSRIISVYIIYIYEIERFFLLLKTTLDKPQNKNRVPYRNIHWESQQNIVVLLRNIQQIKQVICTNIYNSTRSKVVNKCYRKLYNITSCNAYNVRIYNVQGIP